MAKNNRIENMLLTSGDFRLDPDFIMQMIIVGDYSVGKTTALRYMACDKNRTAVEVYCPMSVTATIRRNGKEVKVKIVDTGGQEKYRSLTASYYRGAHGCLILFDVTKESSFDSIGYWLHDLREYTSQPEISTVLVGTKCHVPDDQREVSTERAQKYAESLGLPYMEVSAEHGINVTEVFEKLADMIIESLSKNPTVTNVKQPRVVLQPEKKKKKTCSC